MALPLLGILSSLVKVDLSKMVGDVVKSKWFPYALLVAAVAAAFFYGRSVGADLREAELAQQHREQTEKLVRMHNKEVASMRASISRLNTQLDAAFYQLEQETTDVIVEINNETLDDFDVGNAVRLFNRSVESANRADEGLPGVQLHPTLPVRGVREAGLELALRRAQQGTRLGPAGAADDHCERQEYVYRREVSSPAQCPGPGGSREAESAGGPDYRGG